MESQEAQLTAMFGDALKAFRTLKENNQVKNRKNMPSYQYMLDRFLHMLAIPNADDFKNYSITMLRHEEKTVALDSLFQSISKEAGWID